jgi:hypothetical protein
MWTNLLMWLVYFFFVWYMYYPGTGGNGYIGLNYSGWSIDGITYNPSIDPHLYGSSFGIPRRNCCGAGWNNSTNSGTRSMVCNIYTATYYSIIEYTARGCNKRRNLPLHVLSWDGWVI